MKIDLENAFATPPQPIDYVWYSFVYGSVGALVAPGATGKSFWALEAAMAIACGMSDGDVLGLATKKASAVAYVAAEDQVLILKHRIHTLAKHCSPEALAKISSNLHVESLVGDRIDIMTNTGFDRVLLLAKNRRLIILDTISRFHVLDENCNRDMALLIARLEELAKESGAAVLFIHHVSKSSGRDGQIDQQASRGASALIDNSRWGGYLVQMTEAEARGLSNVAFSNSPIGEEYYRYIRFGENKPNYGPRTNENHWYLRLDDGVLVPAKLKPIETKIVNRAPRLRGAPNAVR